MRRVRLKSEVNMNLWLFFHTARQSPLDEKAPGWCGLCQKTLSVGFNSQFNAVTAMETMPGNFSLVCGASLGSLLPLL